MHLCFLWIQVFCFELSKLYSEDYTEGKYISAFEKTSFKQDGITALARHRRKSMVLNEYLKLLVGTTE